MLVIVIAMVVCCFWMSGCKKSSSEPETPQEQVKTTAEYEAEAKKEISKENMAEELDKLQKKIEQDITQEK